MQNSLNIPMMVYKGRGMDLPVGLKYSSNVWRIDNINTVLNNEWYAYQTMTQAIYAEHSTAGWTSTLDLPKIEFPKLTDVYYSLGGPCRNCTSGSRIATVTIHMPDGATHQLRKSDTPYTGSSVDMSGTFYAIDNSHIRYDGVDADTGTVYLPDGTRYFLDGGNGQVIDRNGNTMSYNGTTRQWTDTIGRPVNMPIPANPQAGDYPYALPGMTGINGGTQNYTFKWRNLTDALAPDENNNTPALRYVAKHYLLYPSQGPTAPNGGNYPQAQATDHGWLFEGSWPEQGPMTMVVGKDQVQGQLFNPVVLAEIVMPNGKSYKFFYNIYGEIEKVLHPTGAFEKYQMAPIGSTWDLSAPYDQATRGVINRKISANGTGNDVLEWKYSKTLSYSTGCDVYRIIAPDNTRTEVYKVHLGAPMHGPPNYREYWDFGLVDPSNGSVIERRNYSTSSDGLGGDLLRRELTQYERPANLVMTLPNGWQVYAYRNLRPTKSVTITLEGGGSALAQTTEHIYDSTYEYTTGVDEVQTKTYHYAVISNSVAQTGTMASISNGALANTIETVFENNQNYRDRYILGLPLTVTVRDSSGLAVSKGETFYDQTSDFPLITYFTGVVQWTDPQTNIRGNPTTLKSYYDLSSNQAIQTHSQYDTFGNSLKAWDGNENLSQIEYSSDYYYAYPTKVTGPAPDATGLTGSNTSFVTTTVFDFNVGLPLSVTDANGKTTTTSYNDFLLRPKTITPPTGGGQTVFEYDDTPGDLSVKIKKQLNAYDWDDTTSFFDGLGRKVKTQKKDSDGDIVMETIFDNMGRPWKKVGPYIDGTPANQIHWTENVYDDLGRIKNLIMADGASIQTEYALATTGSQFGSQTLVTDEALKQRRSITNALGQLTRVDEPNSVGELGTVDNPNQPTVYNYDANGNLASVTQGSQTRSFVYDALSRLKQASNPESGTVSYSYDNSGNMITKTDARNISVTSTYDALNRVKTRAYTDSTPTVSYFYDNLTNARGKLVKISTPLSTTEYTGFDDNGRVTKSRQTTDGTAYNEQTYSYDFRGSLIEQIYPSGRSVRNVLDDNGNIAAVESKKTPTSVYWEYAKHFEYSPTGAVTSMQLGNGHWEYVQFNSRRQPIQIALGKVKNGTDILKLAYAYGRWESGTLNQGRNNGNIAKQTITVPTSAGYTGYTATQVYDYDSLNRIQDATETIGSQTWKQSFVYDRYGNRTFEESTTTTLPKNCTQNGNPSVCTGDRKLLNPAISQTSNRIVQDQDSDQINDYLFDAAGNTTKDATGRNFTYDGENRQSQVKDAGNQPMGQYYYDGEGKRVKKYVPSTGETTIFVYDAFSKLVAEYSTILPGKPQVSYLTSDHLGSPRVLSNADGSVLARHDYLPFGEEIVAQHRNIDPQRNEGLGYASDEVRQKFTGQQKDAESELDYFMARYYSNKFGRFTSGDPVIMEKSRLLDPQAINLYAYVRNNPLKYVDPFGETFKITGSAADIQAYEEDLNKKLEGTGLQVKVVNGYLTVSGTAQKNLKGAAKTILAGINSEKVTNITLVRNDGQIDFGSPFSLTPGGELSTSNQRIDYGDIDQLNKENLKDYNGSDVALHETLEAYYMQDQGKDFDDAHEKAIDDGGKGLRKRGTADEVPDKANSKNVLGDAAVYDVRGGSSTIKVYRSYTESTRRNDIPANFASDSTKGNAKRDLIFRASHPLDVVGVRKQ